MILHSLHFSHSLTAHSPAHTCEGQ
jgi:hypothetical protein